MKQALYFILTTCLIAVSMVVLAPILKPTIEIVPMLAVEGTEESYEIQWVPIEGYRITNYDLASIDDVKGYYDSISFEFSDDIAPIIEEITGDHMGNMVGFFVGDEELFKGQISQRISGGTFVISGLRGVDVTERANELRSKLHVPGDSLTLTVQ